MKVIEKQNRFKEKIPVKEPIKKNSGKLKCNKCGYKIYKNHEYGVFNDFCFKCIKKKLNEIGIGSMVVTDD